MKYKLLLLILAITGAAPLLSLAAGLQVSPSRLDFALTQSKNSSQNIVVVNPTADIQIFEVYADDFSDSIKALPASFTLQSGSRQTVNITVNENIFGKQSSQSLATNLSVVGKPLVNDQFSVGSGVKLPLTVNISVRSRNTLNKSWVFFSIGFLFLAILSSTIVYNKVKHSKTSSSKV